MKSIWKAKAIEELIANAAMEGMHYPDARERLHSDKRKPGERIQKLPANVRELLSTSTSEDFNHRMPWEIAS